MQVKLKINVNYSDFIRLHGWRTWPFPVLGSLQLKGKLNMNLISPYNAYIWMPYPCMHTENCAKKVAL